MPIGGLGYSIAGPALWHVCARLHALQGHKALHLTGGEHQERWAAIFEESSRQYGEGEPPCLTFGAFLGVLASPPWRAMLPRYMQDLVEPLASQCSALLPAGPSPPRALPLQTDAPPFSLGPQLSPDTLDRYTSTPLLRHDSGMLSKLSEDVRFFVARAGCGMTPLHDEAVDYVCRAIKKATAPIWAPQEPTLKVYGSRAVGIALPSSDVDLAVIPPAGVSFDNEHAGAEVLQRIVEVLGGMPSTVLTQRIVSTAVPVLKVVVQIGVSRGSNRISQSAKPQVHIDITMASGLHHHGLLNIGVTKSLQDQLPHLTAVTLVIKQLLCSQQLGDVYTGGLGSHPLTLMVAAFLQWRDKELHEQPVAAALLATMHFFGFIFKATRDYVAPQLPDSPVAGNLRPVGQRSDLEAPIGMDSAGAPVVVLDPSTGSNVARGAFHFQGVQTALQEAHVEVMEHYGGTRASTGAARPGLAQIITRK